MEKFAIAPLRGYTGGVFTLTFDADATVARVAVWTKRFGFGFSRPGTALGFCGGIQVESGLLPACPDSQILASGGGNRTVRLWNLLPGSCLIVPSERTPQDDRNLEAILHGIQTWIALPDEYEETDPWFWHHPASELPVWEDAGVSLTLIAGDAYSRTSPVHIFSPMIYLDAQLTAGKQFTLPGHYSEQAVYSVTEGLAIDGVPSAQHRLAVLNSGAEVNISASGKARCIVIGGEPVGERHKWWNFAGGVTTGPKPIVSKD